MSHHQQESGPSGPRLVLPLIDAEHVAAVLDGRRLPSWAHDYPTPGDLEIAEMLRDGLPPAAEAAFGIRHVVERATGELVGGIGFFGPPVDGRLEIGYGIVPSRQRRGYATEAVLAMLAFAATLPGVTSVSGDAEPANVASVRVLQKSGMSFLGSHGSFVRYQAVVGSPG
ncbi:MAG TPA: GNAT family N-acetyltransferase [Kineosporiaceae bacterium]|jgi:RimJ/RimL family protein N-acetyltransferase|nr:GNAT family N-acetyltransferase [Kineosporiaceae bacterium]